MGSLSADMYASFQGLVASRVVQAFSPHCVAQHSWLTLSMAVAVAVSSVVNTFCHLVFPCVMDPAQTSVPLSWGSIVAEWIFGLFLFLQLGNVPPFG